jgi:hypothetical protein
LLLDNFSPRRTTLIWILFGAFLILGPAALAIVSDIHIVLALYLFTPLVWLCFYFGIDKPAKRVKTITPPHPRIKKDTSYIRKHKELSLGGKLKELAGAILMIFLAPFGLVSFAFAILFFLILLHYLVVMPLLDKFAG